MHVIVSVDGRAPRRRLCPCPPRQWALWASTVIRVALAVVWGWAGLAKIADPDAAVRAVRAYQVVPVPLVRPIAWGLPFAEATLALLLALGVVNRVAAAIGGVLLVVFTGGIVQAWARHLQIACGCFGGGGAARASATTYASELVRDLGLLVLTAWLVVRPASRLAVGAGR